jgi:serine/threonine-protein kinase
MRPAERDFFQYLGSYRILRTIAEGGMGTVYLVEQRGALGFSKTVAIKMVLKDLVEDPMFRDLFVTEAKLTADLIHENITQVYQLIDMSGSLAIVMEYVHGVTLDDINDRLDVVDDYLPPELAAFFVSRVSRALAYAHAKTGRDGRPLGVVHRDVTPPNILVSWQGVVKLSDFGIAKAVTRRGPDERSHLIGKIPYLSPEQARMEGADPRSDIYSLGLVFYEALTGRVAFNAQTVEEVVEMHERNEVTSVRQFNPEIPPELEQILLRMLAYDPHNRFQKAAEVTQALETWLYSDRYGPTNEKLRDYLAVLFPEKDRSRIV